MALSEKRTSLYEDEAEALARAFGIPVVQSKLAGSTKQAVKFANQLGYPVVMKIVSRKVLHKSESGGVYVDIRSATEVGRTFHLLTDGVKRRIRDVDIRGVLVQKMAPRTHEFVIGGMKDPQFGSTVMFGLGGTYVELFKDVTFRLAPITEVEARQMMSEIKSAPLLFGFRGSKPLDVSSAARAILDVGRILHDIPEVGSVDMNPFLIYPHGCLAVDVRITLDESINMKERGIPSRESQN